MQISCSRIFHNDQCTRVGLELGRLEHHNPLRHCASQQCNASDYVRTSNSHVTFTADFRTQTALIMEGQHQGMDGPVDVISAPWTGVDGRPSQRLGVTG